MALIERAHVNCSD